MKNSLFNTASAVAPVSEILSTRKGLIATAIQNDNRKMTVFNRLEEIAMQVKKMIKPAVATIAIGVALAGAMNTVEVNAQAVVVTDWSWGGKWVHIGLNDPNSSTNPLSNRNLTFGYGGRVNEHMWAIGMFGEGLNFNRLNNGVVSNAANGIFYIHNNWNVGIGLGWLPQTPQQRLDVRGNSIVDICYERSDKRYKKEIRPLDENIDKLLKLNSVKYKKSSEVLKSKHDEFKKLLEMATESDQKNLYETTLAGIQQLIDETENNKATYFGFIAQELRELYPELIFEDSEGFLAVNYTGMIPVLVDAIKELKSEIDELKGKGFEKTNATVVSTAKLYQNNPNPFSENTEIKYYVPENANEAMICIYDLTGSQIVRFDLRDRGVISTLTVRGRELKAGMYIYSLIVDGREIDSKRMILTDK